MPRAKLTDKFLQSSKRIVPAAGQTDYWDQLTPGFGVRVSYGGRKSFQVLARINGKLQRFTLGAYPRLSRDHRVMPPPRRAGLCGPQGG
ncbi:Arm DNA-binding domain-containing protein, partial [Methyloceanibacter sp.]|uniref:Arm DNA-binding domain-containing protein n=1 Tax=Methyloceanibacter sp. TaxID=1965321 RepID=UPI003C714612